MSKINHRMIQLFQMRSNPIEENLTKNIYVTKTANDRLEAASSAHVLSCIFCLRLELLIVKDIPG